VAGHDLFGKFLVEVFGGSLAVMVSCGYAHTVVMSAGGGGVDRVEAEATASWAMATEKSGLP